MTMEFIIVWWHVFWSLLERSIFNLFKDTIPNIDFSKTAPKILKLVNIVMFISQIEINSIFTTVYEVYLEKLTKFYEIGSFSILCIFGQIETVPLTFLFLK